MSFRLRRQGTLVAVLLLGWLIRHDHAGTNTLRFSGRLRRRSLARPLPLDGAGRQRPPAQLDGCPDVRHHRMRPGEPKPAQATKLLRVIFLIVALVGLGLIAGGILPIVHKESGAKARASVTGCHEIGGKNTTFQCDGSWVAGGSLVGGGGHVVLGSIDDASPSDLGKTIDVRVSGDQAYTASLRVPIILVVLGLLLSLGSLVLVIAAGRQPAAAPIPTIQPPAPPAPATAEEN